mgnify:CR=1 FL=1
MKEVGFKVQEREAVEAFCEQLVGTFNRAMEARELVPSGHLADRLARIARYARCGHKYAHILRASAVFNGWRSELERVDDVAVALECPRQTEALLRAVQGRLAEVEGVDLDLSGEVRKLRVARLWAQLSLKLHPAHRPTITAAQTTRALMDKIKYPNNCLRRRA